MLIIGWQFLMQTNNDIANEDGGAICLSELQPRRGLQLLYKVALMAAIRAVIVHNQQMMKSLQTKKILQDLTRSRNG